MSSFWLILKQQWTIEEISIFSNSSHLEWRAGQSDTILNGTHPGTIPAWFGLIWFSGFRGKDLNVIFYQNMPNLHNWYKSAERKISQENPEYMLNLSFLCSCSKNLSSFRFIKINKVGKQEVGIWWVQKRFPRYGVPIWSLWPNIRSLPSIVAEKNVTKNVHICSMCIKTN